MKYDLSASQLPGRPHARAALLSPHGGCVLLGTVRQHDPSFLELFFFRAFFSQQRSCYAEHLPAFCKTQMCPESHVSPGGQAHTCHFQTLQGPTCSEPRLPGIWLRVSTDMGSLGCGLVAIESLEWVSLCAQVLWQLQPWGVRD